MARKTTRQTLKRGDQIPGTSLFHNVCQRCKKPLRVTKANRHRYFVYCVKHQPMVRGQSHAANRSDTGSGRRGLTPRQYATLAKFVNSG